MRATVAPSSRADFCPHCGTAVTDVIMVADHDGIDDGDWEGTPLRGEGASLHAEWTSRRITSGDRASTKPLRVEVYLHADTDDDARDDILSWAEDAEPVEAIPR